MPWTTKDVDNFKTGLTDKQKAEWVATANAALAGYLKQGKSQKEAEALAVQTANSQVGAKKFTDDNPNDEPKFGRIRRLWVFRAGEYPRTLSDGKKAVDKFTVEDLDEIVKNFESTGELEIPLVVGHEENQEILQKNTGYPAAGWATKLWREGKDLFAEIKNIPRQVAVWVKNKSYKKVSSEFYRNYQGMGTTLRRIALLGGELPRIKDQGSLPQVEFKDNSETRVYSFTEKERMMDELEKQVAQLAETVTKLSERVDAVATKFSEWEKERDDAKKQAEIDAAVAEKTKQQTKVDDQPAEPNKADKELRTEMAKQFCEHAVKAGKMLPAEVTDGLIEFLASLDDSKKIEFAEGEKQTQYERYQAQIVARPVLVKFGETAPENLDDPNEKPQDKIEKKMRAVFSENESAMEAAGYDTYEEWRKTAKPEDFGIEVE